MVQDSRDTYGYSATATSQTVNTIQSCTYSREKYNTMSCTSLYNYNIIILYDEIIEADTSGTMYVLIDIIMYEYIHCTAGIRFNFMTHKTVSQVHNDACGTRQVTMRII